MAARENWGVQITAITTQFMSAVASMEARLAALGSKATISPTVNTAQATAALGAVQSKTMGMLSTLRGGFDDFGKVLARRFAFTVATAIERTLIGAILAIPAAFAAAVVAGAKFEDAMIRTATVTAMSVAGANDQSLIAAVDATKQGLGELVDTAREVGATTVFTAQEAANAMYELASAGLDAEQTMEAVHVVADLASASQTDMSTATDILTQVMKSFNLEADQMSGAGDAMVLALNTTTLTVGRLQAALRFAAPAAGAVGGTFEDMIPVLAGFVDVTKQGGIAGRAFRFMIQALLDPTKETITGIKNLGISLADIDPRFVSVTDIIRKLSTTTMDASDAAIIFGNRAGPVVAAFLDRYRINLLTGTDTLQEFADRHRQAAEDFAEDGGLMAAQASKFRESVTNQFKLLVSQVNQILISVFFDIQNGLREILTFSSGVLTYVADNYEYFKQVAVGAAQATATFLAILAGAATVQAFRTALVELRIAMLAFSDTTLVASGRLTTFFATLATGQGALFTLARVIGKGVLIAALVALNVKIFQVGQSFGSLSDTMRRLAREFPLLASALNLAATGVEKLIGFLTNLPSLQMMVAQTMAAVIDGLAYMLIGSADLWDWIADKVSRIPGMSGVLDGLGDSARLTAADLMTFSHDLRENAKYHDSVTVAIKDQIEAENALRKRLMQNITDQETFRDKAAAALETYQANIDAGREHTEVLGMLSPVMRELDDIQNRHNITLDEEAQKLLDSWRAYRDQKQAVDELRAAQEALDAMLKEVLGTSMTEITEKLKMYSDAMEYADKVGGELGEAIRRETLEALYKYRDELEKKGIPLTQEMTNEFERMAPAIDIAGEALENIAHSAPDMEFYVTDPVETATEAFEKWKLKMAEAAAVAAGVDQRLIDLAKTATEDVGEAAWWIQKLADTAGKDNEQTWVDFYWQWIDIAAGITRGGDAADGTQKKLDNLARSLDNFMQSLFGDGLGNLSFGNLFKNLAAGLLDGITSMITGGITSLLNTVVGAIGNAISGLFKNLFGGDSVEKRLKNIGNVMGWLGGMSDDLAEKIAELAYELGKVLPAGTDANLVAQFKLLKDIMDDSVDTTEELTRTINIATAGIELFNQGVLTQQEVLASLNEYIPELIGRIDELDARGREAFAGMVDAARAAGLEIEALTEYFVDSAEALAPSIGALLDDFTERWGRLQKLKDKRDGVTAQIGDLNEELKKLKWELDQLGPRTEENAEEFDRLSEAIAANHAEGERLINQWERLTLRYMQHHGALKESGRLARNFKFAAEAMGLSIQELIAQGVPFSQILEIYGDDLERLKLQAEEFGIKLPPLIESLANMMALIEGDKRAKNLIEDLQAMTEIFKNLPANISPTETMMRSFRGNVIRTILHLKELGLSQDEIFMAMAPQIGELIRLHQEYGLKLSDAAKEALKLAGIDIENLPPSELDNQREMIKNLEEMNRKFGRMIDVMKRMIENLRRFAGNARDADDDLGEMEYTAGEVGDAIYAIGEIDVSPTIRLGVDDSAWQEWVNNNREVQAQYQPSQQEYTHFTPPAAGAPQFAGSPSGTAPNDNSEDARIRRNRDANREQEGGPNVYITIGNREVRDYVKRVVADGTTDGTVAVNSDGVSFRG